MFEKQIGSVIKRAVPNLPKTNKQLLELLKYFNLFVFSCSMWDLVPDQGLNSGALHWNHGVLTTGPPGKSLKFFT